MKPDRTLEIHYYDWRLSAWAMSETRDRLNAAGRGIYRELLDHCYAQGSFPSDVDWICRKCACTLAEYEAVWPIISRHFPKGRQDGYRKNIIADMFRKKTFAYLTKQIDAKKGKKKKPFESETDFGFNSAKNGEKREPVTAREIIEMHKLGQTEVEPSIMRARVNGTEGNEREGNETQRNGTAAADAPSSRFPEWWEIWARVRGTNHRHHAEQVYPREVPTSLEGACVDCTVSYLQSLSDPSRGYNPENFLIEQGRDKFTARWPARVISNGKVAGLSVMQRERKEPSMEDLTEAHRQQAQSSDPQAREFSIKWLSEHGQVAP